jgi:antitoxin ParD1/3/4
MRDAGSSWANSFKTCSVVDGGDMVSSPDIVNVTAVDGGLLPMNKMTTVTVSGELADFIEARISAGDYASETEVIEAALALLRNDVSGLAAIKAAIEEGEASGEPQPFDFDDFIERKRRRAAAE